MAGRIVKTIYGSRKVYGTIFTLSCGACRSSFPIFDVQGESDTVSWGLLSAGVCGERKVAVVEFSMADWERRLIEKPMRLPAQIDERLGSDAYRVSYVTRVDRGEPPPKGLSFAAFRKQYKRPVVHYSCPRCEKGEATQVAEEVIEDFKKAGGSIVMIGDLVLVDHHGVPVP